MGSWGNIPPPPPPPAPLPMRHSAYSGARTGLASGLGVVLIVFAFGVICGVRIAGPF